MTLDAEGLWTDSPGSMTTTHGERIEPLDCIPQDIHIADIAHALARQCRYNGHVGGYLSVARHSLWVMQAVVQVRRNNLQAIAGGSAPLEQRREYYEQLGDSKAAAKMAITGLLHDAAEAYLGDMIRPLKHGPLGEAYLKAEEHVEKTIALRFDLDFPFPPEVKEADTHVLLHHELGGERARWTWTSTPDEDEQEFLLAYRQLLSERRH